MNRLHPFTVFLYFVIVIGVTAFTMHPIILCLSFLGVLYFNMVDENLLSWKKLATLLLAFLLLSVINPIFYHNGRTILFVLNDNPVTLEAFIYGMVAAGVIITVLLWCQKLSNYMTTDKTMYLIGKISKKGALIVSMVFRLMPQYHTHAAAIRETQKTLGLFKQESLIDKLTGHLHVFSAMMTWALEHSVDTADSMRARGYGIKKRTSYASYRLRSLDVVFILTMIIGLVIIIAGGITNCISVTYYPDFTLKSTSFKQWAIYLSYALLVFTMPLYESKEIIKWNYLKRKK